MEWVFPQQFILRIVTGGFLTMLGRLLVCRRGHDYAVQVLDAPAVLDEFSRKPIQEFRMCGAIALDAEFAGCADDAFAEMIVPDAIDDHTSGQGIRGVSQDFGQRSAPATVVDLCGFAVQDLQIAGRYLLALLVE